MIEYIVPYTNTILMSVYIITTLKNQISYLKRHIIYIYIYITVSLALHELPTNMCV